MIGVRAIGKRTAQERIGYAFAVLTLSLFAVGFPTKALAVSPDTDRSFPDGTSPVAIIANNSESGDPSPCDELTEGSNELGVPDANNVQKGQLQESLSLTVVTPPASTSPIDQPTEPSAGAGATKQTEVTPAILAAAKRETTDPANVNTAAEQTISSPKQPIKDGVYVIETAISDNKVVDVCGNKKSNGTNVQIYDYNGTDAQKWVFKYDASTGAYKITSVSSGKALDLSGASKSNGANVQIYASNNSSAQRWFIESTSTGYKFISAVSRRVLDVSGASNTNGANIQVYSSNNTAAQRFFLLAVDPKVSGGDRVVEDGAYIIKTSVGSGKVIDISGAGFSNGTNAQSYSNNKSLAQRFYFKYDSNGFYTIQNIHSGLALDVSGASIIPTANVQTYSSNGTSAQLWKLVKNSNGSITFVSKANGLVLDIAGASSSNGANVQVYRDNGSAAQRFILSAAELIDSGLYTLHLKASDSKVVDVPGASHTSNAQMQMYSSNGSFAQKWEADRVGKNTFIFSSLESGMVLTESNGKVVQSLGNGSKQQQWTLRWGATGLELRNVASGNVVATSNNLTSNGTKVVAVAPGQAKSSTRSYRFESVSLVSDGYYVIANALGKVLDVAGNSRKRGANVDQYSANGSTAQVFYVQNAGSGYYRIVNVNTGRVLDVAGGSSKNGANVQIYDSNNTAAQLWKFSKSSAGYLTIANKGSGKVLDVAGGSKSNGANVDIYASNGTNAQKWKLSQTTYKRDSSVVLDVPMTWNQFSIGLNGGCEAMALTNALRYWGYNVGPYEIVDDYMPWGSDFVWEYQGNPYSGGAILAPGLTNTANSYLYQHSSSLKASDISGTSFWSLYDYIDRGLPVIVWTSMWMGDPGSAHYSGGYVRYDWTHTVVFCGYNKANNTVLMSDSMEGKVWRNANDFASLYNQLTRQAVLIQ